MQLSSLLFGLLSCRVLARPHPSNTASSPATTLPATRSPAAGGAARRRSVAATDANPGDLIYEETADAYVFDIGSDLVDKLNQVGSDSCVTSEDDCQTAVSDLLNGLPATGNYFVRSVNETDNGPRQASIIVGAEVAIWAYLLHRLFSEPEPKLIHVSLEDDYTDAEGPIEVTLPKSNFPGSVTSTETTVTTDLPVEKYVLFATSLATNEKGVSALSAAIAAVVTDSPVIPSVSDYGVGLPGWFLVNATLEQQLEIALIPGVDDIIDGLGPLDDLDEFGGDEGNGNSNPVRRSESANVDHTSALVKRGYGSRELPEPDLFQRDDGACLRFASWGDGMQSPPEYYAYQDQQGKDYPIYSLDWGWDLSHAEFGDAQANYGEYDPVESGQEVSADRTWFNGGFANLDSRTSQVDGNPVNTWHGTATLSWLIGQNIGVVPQNRPILVRITPNGKDFEPAFRNIASHIEQRQAQGEKRSPIIALSQNKFMYSPVNGNGADWPRTLCKWAERVAGHLQKIVDLGGTVLIATGQSRSDGPAQPPNMLQLIARKDPTQPQQCWLQHGIDVPAVEGLLIVTSVDTVTRRSVETSLRPNEVASPDLAGPWSGSCVVYDKTSPQYMLGTESGTSLTTYWAAGLLADLAYQAEDKNSLPTPDTPKDRSKTLVASAKSLMWRFAIPDDAFKQPALWNGLRDFDGRVGESPNTTVPSPTSSPATTAAATSTPASTSSQPSPSPSQSWASGWCGIHVRQKVYNSVRSALTVTIMDADGRVVGGDSGDGPNLDYGTPYDVTSELPLVLIATAPGPGKPVNFAYGDQSWTSADVDNDGNPRCGVGKWDGGFAAATRDMDCGFTC